MRRLVLSLFGVGRLPAPGTFASAATFGAILAATELAGWSPWIAAAAAVFLGSLATIALPTPALLAEGDGDPSWVVTDEVAGMGVAWALAALGPRSQVGLLPFVASFALFRLFDIWKPGPVGALERLPRGWGVLADDLAAGTLAGGLVLAAEALRWFPSEVWGL